MGLMSNSALDRIFGRSHIITANWWLADDTKLGFGESNRAGIKWNTGAREYSVGTGSFQFVDPSENVFIEVVDQGTSADIYLNNKVFLPDGAYWDSSTLTLSDGSQWNQSQLQLSTDITDPKILFNTYGEIQWGVGYGDVMGFSSDYTHITHANYSGTIGVGNRTTSLLLQTDVIYIGKGTEYRLIAVDGLSETYLNNDDLIATSGATSNFQTQIDGLSPSGHTHTESDVTDLDHLTEAEMVDHLEALTVTTPVGGDWVIFSDAGILRRGLINALPVTESQISDLTHYTSTDFDTDFALKTTTNLTEGTNLYYTQARFDSAFTAKSTTNLSEGTNLYYTQARFDTAFSAKTTTNLTEGTNLYYTQARFDSAFTAKSTTDLSEGSNLYYTDARVESYLTGLGFDPSLMQFTTALDVNAGIVMGNTNISGANFVSINDASTLNNNGEGFIIPLGLGGQVSWNGVDSTDTHELLANDATDILFKVRNYGVGNHNMEVHGTLYITGAVTVDSTVDGRDIATDGTKLDGIESGATADQTGAEIKSLYEAEANTNAFTDTEKTKLAGIETGATADQTQADINALAITQLGTVTSGNIDAIANYSTYGDSNVESYLTTQGYDPSTKKFTGGFQVFDGNIVMNGTRTSQASLQIDPTIALASAYTTQYGILELPESPGSGQAYTNFYSLYVGGLLNNGGGDSVTNLYGLYVEDVTWGSSTNYSIYNAGSMYLAGSLVGSGYTLTSTELGWLEDIYDTGVTSVEFDYLDGVTSNIQTQLSGKASTSHSHSTLSTVTADIDMGTFDIERIGTVYKSDTSGWFFRLSSDGYDTGTLYNIGVYWDTTNNDTFLSGYSGTGLTAGNASPSQANSFIFSDNNDYVYFFGTSNRTTTPDTTYSHMFLEKNGFMTGESNENFYIQNDNYYTGSWRRVSGGAPGLIQMSDGNIYFYSSTSSTANSTISWTEMVHMQRTNVDFAVDVSFQANPLLEDIANLTDPNADRILFWDDSAGGVAYMAVGSGLQISGGTTLQATHTSHPTGNSGHNKAFGTSSTTVSQGNHVHFSDERLKTDFSMFSSDALSILNRIEIYEYSWDQEKTEYDSTPMIGFKAGQVHDVDSRLTMVKEGRTNLKGKRHLSDLKAVDPNAMNALLLQAIRQLEQRIEELEVKL